MKKFRFLWRFSISLIVIVCFSRAVFSQNNLIEKRKGEHQSVKNLIFNSGLQNYPHQANPITLEKNLLGSNQSLRFSKSLTHADRKNYFMNGNKISTEIYNYGGIAPGYGLLRNVNNVVWRGVSYVYQFSPFVAASVPSAYDSSHKLHIVSDGLWDYPNLREVNPTGDTLWQWQPLFGYDDPTQGLMASNPAEDKDADGKPDSWPREWYNPVLGKYVWPGYLSQDATNADLEVFWAMDDRDNSEFPYYPFINEPNQKRLKLKINDSFLVKFQNNFC